MTTPFKIGLACLLALILATGVTYMLLDGDSSRDTSVSDGELGPGEGTPHQPDGPLTAGPDLRNADEERGAVKLASNSMRPGIVRPHGPTFNTAEARAEHLRALLTAEDIHWEKVASLLSLMEEALSPEARGILLNKIRTGPQRSRVRKAFAQARDPALVDGLMAIYEDGGAATRARKAALDALWQIPAGDANEISKFLESKLEGNTAKDGAVLHALARRGGKEGARAIVEYVQSMEDPASMPPYLLRAVPPTDDEEVRDIIRKGLLSEKTSPEALQSLLRIIEKPHVKGFGETLVQLDKSDQSMDVRKRLFLTMSTSGDSAALAHLSRRADEPGHMGTMALDALGRVKTASADGRKTLMNMLERAPLHSQPEKAKQQLLLALGSLGHRPAMPSMVKALSDDNIHVQVAAVRGLGRMGEAAKEHLPKLGRVFEEGGGALQQRIASAVGQIGGVEALAMMERMRATEGINESVKRTLNVAIRSAKTNR